MFIFKQKNKLEEKKIVIYITIFFLIFCLLYKSLLTYQKQKLIKQINISLEKTKNFYNSNNEPLRADNLALRAWFLESNNEKQTLLNMNDPFVRMLDEKSILDSGIDLELILLDENGNFKSLLVDSNDDLFTRAMYCDVNNFTESDYHIIKKGADNIGGYGDTHLLIHILLIESLGCLDESVFKSDKKRLIESIIDTQKKDKIFSDLYSERIVVLYWAGLNRNIKRSWIQLILKNQNKNGSWSNKKYEDGNFHTTGLSVLSVKYFLNNEVNNIWFLSE